MRISLESTGEVGRSPYPTQARLWVGKTEDGLEVRAWITLSVVALPGTPPEARRRTQQALETRIVSTAEIEIPV